MKFFDLALKRSGMPIDEAKVFFKDLTNKPDSELINQNQQLAWDIFKHHQQNSPFYQAFLDEKGGAGIQNWYDIPVLKKADLQKPLAEMLSNGYDVKSVYSSNTSGSSGTPFYFARDKFCHAVTWASVIERYGWHGLDMNYSRQARFYGIPLEKIKYYKEKIKDWMGRRVRFPVFNLEDKVCARFLEVFKTTKFEYLYGYTNSLVVFAKYCVSQNIVLKNICPTLKACLVTSEVCTKEDKQVLEQGFGVRIVNEYGASELGVLAFEDANGNWVLNEETLLIEVVDSNGRPVADGEQGTIVVTGLFNKAMPFIRYELGDIGVIEPGLRIGHRRVLSQLMGRTNDTATLPSGRKVPGLSFYYVSKSLLEKGDRIKELIVKQMALDHFEIEYVAATELTETEKNDVKEALERYLEPGLKITFLKSDNLERTRAGKLKNFQSMMAKQ
ncbi:phenylacetate--CoA ligase family protein [Polluticaenibacter yanchengensis]|uniref:Phenylacetate--CoA ligase family protein n=1 Tax=Polluticaenibacter yanchengensis TaxID=3014562 RepID=A0ABT4UIA4_9BACT|nr:hypothetical protein [Chitinophagaceae bacterium LY-5]